jgi:CubicO group peptidase (beta-lactamase class C family)
VTEPPGTAYDYSDYQMALLFDLLFLGVYKSSWDRVDAEVLHPLLTLPLQCEDEPTFMAFGTDDRPGRLAVSPRDFARFGLLYLRGGLWDGRRLLQPESVHTATRSPLPNSIPRTAGEKADMLPSQRSIGGGNNQTDHRGSYSFAWWLNEPTREGPLNLTNAPRDLFACLGHGGPRAMVVFPSIDLIVSWNDAKIDGWEQKDHALRLLLGAVRDPDPE